MEDLDYDSEEGSDDDEKESESEGENLMRKWKDLNSKLRMKLFIL